MSALIVVAQDQVSSDLGAETAILNLKNGVYYGLDEVGTRIWELIQEPMSVTDILDVLLAEYEVEPQQCQHDLMVLLVQLAAEELIEINNETTP